MDEFVQYYLGQGVDQLYILYDPRSVIRLSDYVKQHPQIHIVRSTNFGNGEEIHKNICRDVNRLYQTIRKTSAWFIFVDADEFIHTRRDPSRTIRQELRQTFEAVDCIKIPWVMMSCNGRQTNPVSLLNDITHRWNHDLKHPHPNGWRKGRCRYDSIEVKCIFRGDKFKEVYCHTPQDPIWGAVRIVDGVYGNPAKLDPFYHNLREKDIAAAVFLCNHYRIYSYEACLQKCSNNPSLPEYCLDNLDNLWACDYADLVDERLCKKSI
jgi:hypothetical protein